MKNILILTGLNRVQNEDTDDLMRGILHHEFEINYRIEFGNVHRSKARTGDNSDLKFALNNGNKLRGKPFGIREQFPFEIEQRRNLFYPRVDKLRRLIFSLLRNTSSVLHSMLNAKRFEIAYALHHLYIMHSNVKTSSDVT
jgi:hypothetical protein